MTTYARISDGIVAELFTPPEGTALADCFHPDVARTFVSCDAAVQEGWTSDGTTFAAPVTPSARIAPRVAAGYSLLMAISDDAAKKLKPRDMARLSGRANDMIPETSAFVVRVAGVIDLSTDEWFDTALSV